MTPLCFCIGSLSLGDIRRFLIVVPPLKYTCYHILAANFLNALTWSTVVGNHYVGLLLVASVSSICLSFVGGLLLCFHFDLVESPAGVFTFLESTLKMFFFFLQQLCIGNRWFVLYVVRCQSHCILMLDCGDCPIVNKCLYVLAF